MSRKHYVAIAASIRKQVDWASSLNPVHAAIMRLTLLDLAVDLATVLKSENSSFDRTRFLDACGLGD